MEEVAGDGAVGEGMLLWHYFATYGRETDRFGIVFLFLETVWEALKEKKKRRFCYEVVEGLMKKGGGSLHSSTYLGITSTSPCGRCPVWNIRHADKRAPLGAFDLASLG